MHLREKGAGVEKRSSFSHKGVQKLDFFAVGCIIMSYLLIINNDYSSTFVRFIERRFRQKC